MTKVLPINIILVLTLALTNCGSGGAQSNNNPPPPVSLSLSSLQMTPGNASVAPGAVQQFTATGKYSDGSSKDLTASAQWKTSDSNIASVAGGKVTGVGAGTVMVTATSGKLSASATLKVNSAATNLASISVSPTASSLPVNTSQQFTATGTYKDGSSRDLTALVSWASTFSSIATVDVTGVATVMSAGSTTISASLGGITGSTSLTVTA